MLKKLKQNNPTERDGKKGLGGLATGIGWLLAAPGTIVASLQLVENSKVELLSIPHEATISVASLGIALLIWRPVSRAVRSTVSLMRSRWAEQRGRHWLHLDQQEAQQQFPHYSQVMEREIDIKSLTPVRFQRELESQGHRIPLSIASFLLENLHVVPRPDLIDRIELALMLPKGSFMKGFRGSGVSLNRDLAIKRLKWLNKEGIADIHTYAPVMEKYTVQKIIRLHDAVESHILEDVRNSNKEVL